MMLCPLNVVLKLNRFVNVTCSFNIGGEYFKAQYFSIPLACCFFTNQLTGFFVPLHSACMTVTGGFESYDSHQLLCGGMVERFDWFLAKNQSGCCRFDPCFFKTRLCFYKRLNLKICCLALLFCEV